MKPHPVDARPSRSTRDLRAIAVVAVTSIILKLAWCEHLKKMEIELAYAPVTQPVQTETLWRTHSC